MRAIDFLKEYWNKEKYTGGAKGIPFPATYDEEMKPTRRKVAKPKQRIMAMTNEELNEVKMNPNALKQMAANIRARAGIEFEMVVPDAEGDEEPDYNEDRKVYSISEAEDFFLENDYNPRREVQSLVRLLEQQYHEWVLEKREEEWKSEGWDFFVDYAEDYFDEEDAREEAMEELEINDPDNKKVRDFVEDMKKEWLRDEWDNESRIYHKAYSSWEEDFDIPEEADWLRDVGIRYMSDIESSYQIGWPFWEKSEKIDFSDIRSSFTNGVGRRIMVSDKYHGGDRLPGMYSVEPDSSITPDDKSDRGLEFISPPLPIDETLDDLKKVIKWAKSYGCYTNESTGLHMNVSIPNYSQQNVDYVKLAILLGDDYILRNFQRQANTYTVGAMSKIRNIIEKDPYGMINQVFPKMKEGLIDIASNLIHRAETEKYTSINLRPTYVEFRAPGGDWLNLNIDLLENTLLRYVVALDAACDPNKYKKEYLKKLYTLLAKGDNDTTIYYFVNYATGNMDPTTLKQKIKSVQTQREKMKPQPNQNELNKLEQPSTSEIEV